jgi:hypothetical protein
MNVWGYYDAGGLHENPDKRGRQAPTVSVAGYLLTAAQAYEFDRLWMKRLKQDKLPYFHMTEFIMNSHAFQKCATWSEAQKLGLLEDLISIIANNVSFGIGMVVHRADYKQFLAEEPHMPEVLGQPYAFCAFGCFESGADWLKKKKLKGNINYIFERGDLHFDQVDTTHAFICRHERLNQRYRLGSLTAAPVDHSPLQAADLLTWEINREFYRQLYPEPEHEYTRDTLVALMRRVDGDYRHYGADELRGYFDDFMKKKQPFIINISKRLARMTVAEMKAEQEAYEKEKDGGR